MIWCSLNVSGSSKGSTLSSCTWASTASGSWPVLASLNGLSRTFTFMPVANSAVSACARLPRHSLKALTLSRASSRRTSRSRYAWARSPKVPLPSTLPSAPRGSARLMRQVGLARQHPLPSSVCEDASTCSAISLSLSLSLFLSETLLSLSSCTSSSGPDGGRALVGALQKDSSCASAPGRDRPRDLSSRRCSARRRGRARLTRADPTLPLSLNVSLPRRHHHPSPADPTFALSLAVNLPRRHHHPSRADPTLLSPSPSTCQDATITRLSSSRLAEVFSRGSRGCRPRVARSA